MGFNFNADEILEVAERIESLGARFYALAARTIPDAGMRRTLEGLADMEEGHMVVFARMREGLSESEQTPPTFDPDGETAEYLQAVATGAVFDTSVSPEQLTASLKTPADVYRKAIEMENQSIEFYTRMKPLAPGRWGAGKMDAIIAEERGHVQTLTVLLGAA